MNMKVTKKKRTSSVSYACSGRHVTMHDYEKNIMFVDTYKSLAN